MSTPDVSGYVDLEPFDVEPEDLLDNAIANAEVALPGYQAREGNIDVVLLEQQAAMTAELVYAINRLPGAVFAGWLRLFGVEADLGAPATTTVEFTLSDGLGHDIPSGTRLTLDGVGEGVDELVLTTDQAITVPAGSYTGSVAATATDNLAAMNDTPAGTVLNVMDAILYVERATMTAPLTGGRNPEDDASFLDRGSARLRRLTESLVLPEHFTAYAAEDPNVGRVVTVDNTDPGTSGVGDDPGHVTVAALDLAGDPLTSAAKTALAAELDARSVSQLVVHVADPTITDVNVTTVLRRSPGWSDEEVVAFAQDALGAYLSPQTWEWGGVVRRNELVALLSQVPGVDYVVSLTTPSGDVTLPGVAPLADAGTFNVTTQAP